MNLTEANNLIKQSNRVHFIGIGGIGISAIAKMMLLNGKRISGSDKETGTLVIKELKKLGAKIYVGHASQNVTVRHSVSNKPDLVVYTTAIPSQNPELKRVKKLKIPRLTYPEALGAVSKDKYTIAVSGCHGKTTTTAMLGKILIDAKQKPTVIVGSFLKDQKSNLVVGKSKFLICEACEYRKAFLNLTPEIIVITNIDDDHLDYYGNLKNIQKAFSEFISKLGENDWLVCDKTDKNSASIIKKAKCKIFDYSKIKFQKNFRLKIPGQHNIKNAKAALAVSKILKINLSISLKALHEFRGTWRRFEYKGKTKNGVLVYDDYAHHPTEIRAMLKAARELRIKNKELRIFAVFQPHLYSRTKFLLDEFAKSFNDVDCVIVAPIYAAREQKDKKISSEILADKIKKHSPNTIYIKSFKETENFLRKNARKNDIIITMGAGDVFKIAQNLVK